MSTPQPTRSWSTIDPGEKLPGFDISFPFRKIIMTPGVTLDYLPVHYDRGYAKSVGHPTIFVNTMPLFGLVDRVVTDWAGPTTFITRHSIKLRVPVYEDDVVTASGRVVDKRVGASNGDAVEHLVDIAVVLTKADGAIVCCEGSVTARVDP